jgi:hypothetical protein
VHRTLFVPIVLLAAVVGCSDSPSPLVGLIEQRHVADEGRQLRKRTDEYFANAGGGATASRERSPNWCCCTA